MNKFMDVLEKYLTPFSQMVANNHLLQSIKDAFILGIPFTVVGSICGLIKSQLEYWLTQAGVSLDGFLGSLIHVLGNVGTVAMGLMGIVIVLSSSYFYAQRLKENNNKVVPLMTSLLALVSYFATIPWEVAGESETLSGFALNYFNYEGMFTGLLIGLSTAWLYSKLVKSKFTIKLPDSVPTGVLNSFLALIPISIILIIFSIVKEVVVLCGFTSLQAVIAQFIVTPLSNVGTGLPAIIIVILLMQLLWFFGLHGFSIIWGVVSSIWLPLFMEQIDTFAKTQSFDSITQVAPNTISNIYAMLGGSGSTLALIVVLLILAPKKSAEKEIAKMSLVPGIFNINEPIIFGLPIVLNPMMFIPFVFIPVVNAIIAYFAVSMHFVNPMVVLNSGQEPIFFNAWVLGAFTLSPVILMMILFVIDMVLYAPFAKMVIKQNQKG
ncbi:MAG: PTS sugar transporter subunit IIC [Massilimicrobiota timonensis]